MTSDLKERLSAAALRTTWEQGDGADTWEVPNPDKALLTEALATLTSQAERIAELEDGEHAWQWLSDQTNLSLDFDWPVEAEDGEWQVHRVTGNVNDREWELVGSGGTPLAAIIAAAALLQPKDSADE